MTLGLRVAAVVFVAAIFQVSALSQLTVFGAAPDLLLVSLVSLAMLRGSIVGALAGFAGGLIVDVATLGTLGVTSLLLTVAGYWAGRYAETTGRGRAFAPYVAVAAITVVVGVGAAVVHFLLGDAVVVQRALLPLLPAIVLNLLLAAPVHRLCRRIVGETPRIERLRNVEVQAV
ncbi:MAG TPA: rod shape-determining protein MreD [Gaiellaceae bacterium]|nr:rod shape-determining protein MreD [Gaiellaceae bacterium]